MAVVVPDVAVEDAKEVATPGDQEMIEAFPAHGADPPLGNGVGVRAWIGVQKASPPPARQMSSKARMNLRSRSQSRNPKSASASSEPRRFRACWATHAPVGLAVIPARWTRRCACRRRNDRQLVAAGRGAGWRPLAGRAWRWSLPRPGSQGAAAPRGCADDPRVGSWSPAARSRPAPAGEPMAGTMRRCHPSSVWGVTMKIDHRAWGGDG